MAKQLNEMLALVACIDPDAYNAGTVASDVIDMRYFERVLFIVMAGTMASTSTIDFKVQECATSGGTYTDITGKAITQLTEAGTDRDKQAEVEVAAYEMTEGHRYLRGLLTVGTAASDTGAVALANCSRYQPASDFDLASVDEIVT